MFHDIFISQIFGKFLRTFSGKVPLFFRKCPEKFRGKFPAISQLTTLVVVEVAVAAVEVVLAFAVILLPKTTEMLLQTTATTTTNTTTTATVYV